MRKANYNSNKKIRTSKAPFPGCYDRSYYDRRGNFHSYYTNDSTVGTSGCTEFSAIAALLFFGCIFYFVINVILDQHITERPKINGDSSQILIADNIDILTTSEEAKLEELLHEIYKKSGIAVTIYTDNLKWREEYETIEEYSKQLYYNLGNSQNRLLVLYSTEVDGYPEYDFFRGKETAICLTDDLLLRLKDCFHKGLYSMDPSDALIYAFHSIMDELAETSVDWDMMYDLVVATVFLSFFFAFPIHSLFTSIRTALHNNAAYRYYKKNKEKLSYIPVVLYNSCPNCAAPNSTQSQTCSYCNSLLKVSNTSINSILSKQKKDTNIYQIKNKTSKTPFQGCYDRSYYDCFRKYHHHYTGDESFGTISTLRFFNIFGLSFLTFLLFLCNPLSNTVTIREKMDADSSRIFIEDTINIFTESEEDQIANVLQDVYEKSGMAVTVYTTDQKWHQSYSNIEAYSHQLYYRIGVDENSMLLLYTLDNNEFSLNYKQYDCYLYCGDNATAWATDSLKNKLLQNIDNGIENNLKLSSAMMDAFHSILNDLTEVSIDWHKPLLNIATSFIVYIFLAFFYFILFSTIDRKQLVAYCYFKKHPEQLSYQPVVFLTDCPSCGATNSALKETCSFCHGLLKVSDKNTRFVSPRSLIG